MVDDHRGPGQLRPIVETEQLDVVSRMRALASFALGDDRIDVGFAEQRQALPAAGLTFELSWIKRENGH